ncbi:helix-turn-helix domain-containing protein [Dichotomicrobium thermohalophilum]|nr:helix-turn-helix domain-containing protein [Dichotomicrobium thermohalophilum]
MKDVPLPEHYIGISSAYQAQYIQFSALGGLLEQAVSTMFAVPRCELRAGRRCEARVAFARQVAMYLAHIIFGLTLSRVGQLFGRDRTTVAHGCAVVEDRREDVALDRALNIVENALRRAPFRGVMSGGNH